MQPGWSDRLPQYTGRPESPLPPPGHEHLVRPPQDCQHLWSFWEVSLSMASSQCYIVRWQEFGFYLMSICLYEYLMLFLKTK